MDFIDIAFLSVLWILAANVTTLIGVVTYKIARGIY